MGPDPPDDEDDGYICLRGGNVGLRGKFLLLVTGLEDTAVRGVGLDVARRYGLIVEGDFVVEPFLEDDQ